MAIDFQATFGQRSNNRGQRHPANDLPKAQFWLNIGYLAGEAEDARFVSLPVGIPLDTMERLGTRSSNADFAMFQAARNDLLDQLLEVSGKLAPGQDYVIPCEGDSGLAIQIRRVNEEQAAPTLGEANPYARRVVAAAA